MTNCVINNSKNYNKENINNNNQSLTTITPLQKSYLGKRLSFSPQSEGAPPKIKKIVNSSRSQIMNSRENPKEGLSLQNTLNSPQKLNLIFDRINGETKISLERIRHLFERDCKEILEKYQEEKKILFPKKGEKDGILISKKKIEKIIFESNCLIDRTRYRLKKVAFESKIKDITLTCLAWRYTCEQEIKIYIGNFEVINSRHPAYLGKGGYGTAQKIFDLSKKTFVALKISNDTTSECVYSISKEISTLSRFNNRKGLQSGADSLRFDNGHLAYITKLYNKGSLRGFINVVNTFSSSKLLHFITRLFQGPFFLHSCNIIHGDIKPDNYLVHATQSNGEDEYEVDLADLGSVLSKKDLSDPEIGITVVSTQGYYTETDRSHLASLRNKLSVEEDSSKFELQVKRDIFAVAATAWYLATGAAPYELKKEGKKKNPDTSSLRNRQTVIARLDSTCADILAKALAETPSERPAIEEIVNVLQDQIRAMSTHHPSNCKDIVLEGLQPLSTTRATSSQLLSDVENAQKKTLVYSTETNYFLLADIYINLPKKDPTVSPNK